MNLTTTSLRLGILTLLLLGGSACASFSQSAVQDLPPAPTPTAIPAAQPAQPAEPAKDDLIPRIRPLEAIRLVNSKEALIIDVRDTASYDYMHVKGAINISYADFVAGKFTPPPQNKHLIFYCTCPREHSAALSAVILQEKGYQKVSALQDGLYGYKDAGGDIVMKN